MTGTLSVGPGVIRGNQFVFDAVAKVIEQLPYDYVVISWLRVGARTTSGNVSNHASGDALDLRPVGAKMLPGSPCGGSVLDQRSQMKMQVLVGALSGMGNRGTGEPVLWKTCTGGNHHDHTHVAVMPGANVKTKITSPLSVTAKAGAAVSSMPVMLSIAVIGGAVMFALIIIALAAGRLTRVA